MAIPCQPAVPAFSDEGKLIPVAILGRCAIGLVAVASSELTNRDLSN